MHGIIQRYQNRLVRGNANLKVLSKLLAEQRERYNIFEHRTRAKHVGTLTDALVSRVESESLKGFYKCVQVTGEIIRKSRPDLQRLRFRQ